jgi:hypothetical protein
MLSRPTKPAQTAQKANTAAIGSSHQNYTKIILWQPLRGHRFAAHEASSGGLFGAGMSYRFIERLVPYVEMVGKSAGWVAGQVELNKNLQSVAGLEFTL